MMQSANKRKLRTGLRKCNQCTLCYKVYLTSWLSHVLPSAIATSHSYLITRKLMDCLSTIERNPSTSVNMIPVIELYHHINWNCSTFFHGLTTLQVHKQRLHKRVTFYYIGRKPRLWIITYRL